MKGEYVMHRLFIFFVFVITCFSLLGCGTSAKEIRVRSQNDRTDVFTEVKLNETIPKSFSDLIIKANIKTHVEGYYILESKNLSMERKIIPFW
jgi:hypothetical protein